MSGSEVLGTSADVIGILMPGLQAARFIADSVSKYQDAEEDCIEYLNAMQRLAWAFRDVNELLQVDVDRFRYPEFYRFSRKCQDELVNLQTRILDYSGSMKKSQTVETWSKFKHVFMEDNSKTWLESVERSYGQIEYQLHKIQLENQNKRKAAVERVEPNITEISEAVSSIEDVTAETSVHIDDVEGSAAKYLTSTQQANSIDTATMGLSWTHKRDADTLLENGANPLLNPENIIKYAREADYTEWQSLLEKFIESHDVNDAVSWTVGCETRRIPVLHAILWDYATDFIWKDSSTRAGFYNIKEIVRKLIASGADTSALTLDGENCLHMVMQVTRVPNCVIASDSRALLEDLLLFLVGEIEIDVRSLTNDGISVSDLAFWQKCPAGRCIWPIWVSALLEHGYDPLGVAKGSMCFGKIEQVLSATVDGHCYCQHCDPGLEDDYVEISNVDPVYGTPSEPDEVRVLDPEPLSPVSSEYHGKESLSYLDNDIGDDYDFLENWTLGSDGKEGYQRNHDVSVNDWTRVFGDQE